MKTKALKGNKRNIGVDRAYPKAMPINIKQEFVATLCAPGGKAERDRLQNIWKCSYRPYTGARPSIVSRTWTNYEEKVALHMCVQQMWAWHTLHTGEACPLDMDVLFA